MFAGEAVSRLSDVPMGEGRARAAAALDSGEALEAFRRMIEAQGGDPRVVDDPEGVLPAAAVRRSFAAERAGTAGGRRRRGARARERRARCREEEEGRPDRPGGGHRLPAEGGRPPRGRTGARAGARSERRGRGGVHPLGPGRDSRSRTIRSNRRRSSTGGTARWTTSSSRLYLGISLVPALVLHEYAHAFVAVRLGDPDREALGPAHPEPQAADRPVRLADPAGARADPGRGREGCSCCRCSPTRSRCRSTPRCFKNPRRDMNLVVAGRPAREHRARVPRRPRDQGRGDRRARHVRARLADRERVHVRVPADAGARAWTARSSWRRSCPRVLARCS